MVNRFNRNNKGNKSSFVQSKISTKLLEQANKVNIAASRKAKLSLIQRFYNRPISQKQWIALLASQLVPILGIGMGATLIMNYGLRSQLLEQANSEVAVTDINYNIKVNEMGFGFRGQSDNAAIIKATLNYDSGRVLSSDLKAEVKQILQNEIQARKIEYATLVGKDLRIIVNANKDRTGEVFNPENLVSQVFNNPQQIKANGVVRWSELTQELPPLPDNFSNQDALIRYTVTSVKDPINKTVIGALISGDIVNGKDPIVKSTLKATGGGYSAVYFRKPTGEFALATAMEQGESDDLNRATLNVKLPPQGKSLLEAAAKSPEGKTFTVQMKIGNQAYTMAAKAIPNKIIEETNGPKAVFGEQATAILVRGTSETKIATLLWQSMLQQALVILIALLLIAAWAHLLGRGIIRPIQNLQQTTEKFATVDRTSRAKVFATDEVGDLAVIFNTMADRITAQAIRQENEAKLALQLNQITADVRESFNTEKILKAAVYNTRDAIQSDRVLFYRLDNNFQGTIIAESVDYELSSTLGINVANPYLVGDYSEEYEIGSVKAVDDIYNDSVSENYLEQLEALTVKAYLLSPVFVNKKLYGLFVAQQCSNSRQWQDIEVNLFKQVALQVGYALEQAQLVQQIEQKRQTAVTVSVEERQKKQALQMQLLKLLNDVEGAASGDLTVRADVSEGEIGTVADFFNSIVESLRAIVTKVKVSAVQVNQALGHNEGAIRQLAEEALTQATEINRTLDAVDEMTFSMQAVAENAQQAAIVANQAKSNAEKSGEAMDLTVQNILHLRETVGQTAKKVKYLGESTQEISRVVTLINQIAKQTNLLAINAGIEAARAGEEGQGFVVVAEEIGELASRSAFATQEIEHIVENIQRETSELVKAIELGTSQVVEGTWVVEDAKSSLDQILEVSRQIDSLVQSISSATASQVETSQTVSELMKAIACVSQRTSESSRQVSESLQQTVEISQELQQTVETFKVS
ncbi:MAG: methyl-accepting chemotaxis protein [Heteroscytonema crispum UTEX LB 1556]